MLISLCGESKEKIALHNHGDSLKLELMAINSGFGLKEVEALIDSIDASRYRLQLKIIE
jgi:hypothetical protein